MELKDLKMLFDSGVLIKAIITTNIMGDGFIVSISAKNNKHYVVSGQRTKGEPRVFKSIDAAAKNATDIGFREVLISFTR